MDVSQRAIKVFETRGLGGQESEVALIKLLAAQLWDVLDSIPVHEGNNEAMRLVNLARTHLEESVMWGVKALSRNY